MSEYNILDHIIFHQSSNKFVIFQSVMAPTTYVSFLCILLLLHQQKANSAFN